VSATMAILDGYTVEPSGLGVPPYLSTYVRNAYSALWKACPSADVRYLTIDAVPLALPSTHYSHNGQINPCRGPSPEGCRLRLRNVACPTL
jgi:hypothetical protein